MKKELQPHLKLGFMSTSEMHLWFGYTEKSHALSTAKGKEKLVELNDYCAWEKVRGGFNIIEIYPNKEVYVKKGSKNYELIKKEFLSAWKEGSPEGHLINQGINVANIILVRIGNELTLAPSTIPGYVSEIKVAQYGKSKDQPGLLGWSRRILVKRRYKNGKSVYELFTPEELEKKKEIRERIFGERSEEEEDEIILAYNEYRTGECSKKDMDNMVEIIHKRYTAERISQYFKELNELAGCEVLSATELINHEKVRNFVK